jgi:Flp pilus assembly pilin Flp
MEEINMKQLKNNKGQSLLEYIILTSLIGIFCLTTVSSFGKRLKTKISNMNRTITEKIQIP